MRIDVHPEAQAELNAAALWYEQQQPFLGEKFLLQFELTLRQISIAPSRRPKILGNNRKCKMAFFPYAIVYSASEDVLIVKAVMHLHRRPFYWSSRT